MRKRTMIVIAITSATVVAIGGTAFAKGPESATITGPGINAPIELINVDFFDTDYTDHVKELMRQTSLWYATGGGSRIAIEPAGALGSAYMLTWINSGPPGDPLEERTIRQLLYLRAEGGPVIHTPAQKGLEGWVPGVVGWFTAPDGLTDTLAALGVPVPASESLSEVSASIDPTAAPSVEAEPTAPLGYLAVGFGLAFGLVRAARRRKDTA